MTVRRLAFGLLIALTAAVIATTAFAPRWDSLHRAVLWSLVLLVSFSGWGRLVARLAFPGCSPDVGLRVSWGVAALLVLGGAACLLSLAARPVLFGIVVAGVALEYRDLWRDMQRERASTTRPWVALVLAGVAALAAIHFYAGAAGTALSIDDYISYLAFPQEILGSGSLSEPFGMRRLAAYGGQSLLHAFALIGAAHPLQIPLVETGVCFAAVLALIIGGSDRAGVCWLLAVVVVLTMPNTRFNSASMMSGVLVFLALFRTASWPGLSASPRRGAAVLGMLAAAAAALRHSYLVAAVAFLVILYAPAALQALRLPSAARRKRLAELAIAPAAMLACVLPWALLSYRSSGTVLYPLFAGNYRSEYGHLSAANPETSRAAFLWVNIRHCHPVLSLPLFIAAALLTRWHRSAGALPALAWASVLGFVAIVWGFPLADRWNVARYYFAFTVATAVAVAMHVCRVGWPDWRADLRGAALPGALAIAALAIQLGGVTVDSFRNYTYLIGEVRGAPRKHAWLPVATQRYRTLQAAVPAGAPLLVMLDRPFLLDFSRNPIDIVDVPGLVSPPPGMPLDDDDALVDYLARHGYRYVAFVRPAASENQFVRKSWQRMLGPPASPLWGRVAPYVLKLFDRFDSLTASRARLYDDGKMVVLDLATRTS